MQPYATPSIMLCPGALSPVLDALHALALDGSLDDGETALRLDQYELCALGAPSPELAFDPLARELGAVVATLRDAATLERWSRRVRPLFAALRDARDPASEVAIARAQASLVTLADEPATEPLRDVAIEFLDAAWDGEGAHFPMRIGATRALDEGAASPPESFTAAIVADLTLDRPDAASLNARVFAMLDDELRRGDEALYFFKDHARLPADVDCTAIACSVLLRAGRPVAALAHRALDRIVANVNPDGVVATYFVREGDRANVLDPVVCINALYLAQQLGRAHELRASEAYVLDALRHGRYLDGTRYYPSPDTFLHFLGRLVCDFPRAYGPLRPALARAILRRRGVTAHPIDVAQRVVLARRLGFANPVDEARLHALRRSDGAWPADSLFRYGRTGVLFGSASLATAFGLRALDALQTADVGGAHALAAGVRHAS